MANQYNGNCDGKFSIEGDPIGEQFTSTSVIFSQALFDAIEREKNFRLFHGKDLGPGTHDIVVGENGATATFRNSVAFLDLSGTYQVTISSNRLKQEGKFELQFNDTQGNVVEFKGKFIATHTPV